MIALRRPILALLVPASLLLPASAQAGVRDLWATVNSCDTPNESNEVGVRASMPGNGTNQRIYMRFEAQWFSIAEDRFLPTGSSTRWLRVGSARQESTQAGFGFQFADPPPGEQYVLRGRVDFRWTARRKRRWAVVRTATRITRGGIRGVEGGQPPGRSDALCVIRR